MAPRANGGPHSSPTGLVPGLEATSALHERTKTYQFQPRGYGAAWPAVDPYPPLDGVAGGLPCLHRPALRAGLGSPATCVGNHPRLHQKAPRPEHRRRSRLPRTVQRIRQGLRPVLRRGGIGLDHDAVLTNPSFCTRSRDPATGCKTTSTSSSSSSCRRTLTSGRSFSWPPGGGTPRPDESGRGHGEVMTDSRSRAAQEYAPACRARPPARPGRDGTPAGAAGDQW